MHVGLKLQDVDLRAHFWRSVNACMSKDSHCACGLGTSSPHAQSCCQRARLVQVANVKNQQYLPGSQIRSAMNMASQC